MTAQTVSNDVDAMLVSFFGDTKQKPSADAPKTTLAEIRVNRSQGRALVDALFSTSVDFELSRNSNLCIATVQLNQYYEDKLRESLKKSASSFKMEVWR